MRKIWKEYFNFSKKERTAILLLLLIMAGFIAAPYCYRPAPAIPEPESMVFPDPGSSEYDTVKTADSYGEAVAENDRKPETFYFDPNTLEEQGWRKLGIPARTVQILLRYREKGGRFRQPEDLQKIWGMRRQDAERLQPYVRIADRPQQQADKRPAATPAAPAAKLSPIDINTATEAAWKVLPGIGDVLASRITRFRERIGGFSSVEQVRKTYGISDSLFTLISPHLLFNPSSMPAVNINTASAYELRIKFGLPYAIANALVRYREAHGIFQSLNEIPGLVPMPDSIAQKLILRGRL
ncbi:ComEA family DNA-binding protein [Sediminibacterium soli]|uniref:ComEA family DNA-binding protein n=1 Tax=Sediminibacterium soli TaxID=2698829 RepID=UPI00137B59D1|nr:helix-hairpin-helix domain-containing protein [Sediminibacterium soli]NCI45532.1 helix-hairpin-helix domain-containing protein [Sediminibacterium soli]